MIRNLVVLDHLHPSLDDLDLNHDQDELDLDQSREDRNPGRRIARNRDVRNRSRPGHIRDLVHDPKSPDQKATIEVSLENRGPIRAIPGHRSLAQNRPIRERIISIPAGNEMLVQAVAPNQKKTKGRKTRMISKLERRRMVFRQSGHTEKRTKMIVAATVTRVEKENLCLKEEVPHREKIGPDQRTEIDPGIDREIDPEIDHVIDLEIETGGAYNYFSVTHIYYNYLIFRCIVI